MYIGDKENSNSDSALVSTKRSLIYNQPQQGALSEIFYDNRGAAGVSGWVYLYP